MLTTELMCKVRNHNFKRNIRICKMSGLTKSLDSDVNNFIVHVSDEYDYQFIPETREKRDEFFEATKECYFKLMNENLPIYAVPGSVAQYVRE